MNTVIVKSSRFNAHYPVDIPKNTVNAEAVLIRLDSEWDSLTVRIHWLNVASKVEKNPLLERDKPNTIPWEVLTDLGELRMGLVGLDGETVIKPTIWLTYGYVTEGVDPEAGDDPQPPTPSWEQQMVEQAKAAANAAKEAKETADSLQAAAEAGEFNGDPGPEGPPGKSPEIRGGTWWRWDQDEKAWVDTGVVAAGGSSGTTDYTKLTNKPFIGGVEVSGNKTLIDYGAPSWSMQQKKPTYTPKEIGAQPEGNYVTKSEKLANPYSITFKGAVNASYDGSNAVTVNVPTIAGPVGPTPSIQVGEVTTLGPEEEATVSITGTDKKPIVNFGLPRGFNGLPGKTPQKGIDYFTDAEKKEMVNAVLSGLPVYGGEVQ